MEELCELGRTTLHEVGAKIVERKCRWASTQHRVVSDQRLEGVEAQEPSNPYQQQMQACAPIAGHFVQGVHHSRAERYLPIQWDALQN